MSAIPPTRKPVPPPAPAPVNGPYVRPYYPGDFDDVLKIYRATADASVSSEPALTIGSYMWCRPYTYFYNSEALCFVLDDGNGVAVGYIIGAPDTANFVRAYKDSYLPSLEGEEGLGFHSKGGKVGELSQLVLEPEYLEWKSHPGLLQNFPAHLHINILPQFQRGGFGARLVHTFCDTLRNMNVPGVHLGMVSSNTVAGRFYAKMGFERFPEILDGGKSGLSGRKDGADILVGKL